MRRIFRFLVDLYRDGWGLLGFVAPLFSILGTAAKLLAVDMQWITDLSWGWVFAPIAGWLLVAYIRRWQSHCAQMNPSPDWPAKDAFRYLMIDSKWALGKNPNDGNILTDVEGTLRDQAKLGHLSVWARRPPSVMGGDGFWETITKISENEWDRLSLDLPSCIYIGFETTYLLDLKRQSVHQYEDVQVNKEQVFSVWPKANFFERFLDSYRKQRLNFYEAERRNPYGPR